MKPKILDAALRVFMRYGVGRTRMGDIAKEAGVSRQTLYKNFQSKDDVLAGTIRHFSDIALADIQKDWATTKTLAQMLDVYFEHAIISSFAMISASPDARDMIGGYNESGKHEIERVNAHKIKTLEHAFKHQCTNGFNANPNAAKVADFVHTASIGLRDTARDEAHLREMLEILKLGVLKIVDPGRGD